MPALSPSSLLHACTQRHSEPTFLTGSPQVEEEEYQLKPMNCPFHVAMYKDGYFSYRDLPKRWAELGTVYR